MIIKALHSLPLLLVLLVVIALSVPASLAAHPGHDHKLMGTITSIDKGQVVIKTTDGKDRSFEISTATKLMRGKRRGTMQELKVGMRVVVNVGDGAEPLRAKEVQYTDAVAAKSGS